MTKELIETVYLNQEVHVIIQEGNQLFDGWGIVTFVDNSGRLHGTWGDLPATIGVDYIGMDD